MSQTTIAAIATASGVGSIAIIRLSGSRAKELATAIAPKVTLENRVAKLTSIYNSSNDFIDRAIVLYFQAPASFTGEDIVEIQCHGGAVIAQEILDTLLFHGSVLAKPGEFTQRAFLNGKIDLSEAEAIAKMIEVKSVDGAKILARQLKGELGRFINAMRKRLITLLAHSEVMIDYAEEDIPQDLLSELQKSLESVEQELEQIVLSSKQRKGLIEGFWLGIVGKPNVGKSSILNKMLNFDRAIVSDIAGTTRDTIEEQIRIGTHLVRVADTAGIRDASDTIEKLGVERSIKWLEESDILIAVFDASKAFNNEDKKVLQYLRSLESSKVIVVLNKIDEASVIDKEHFKEFNTIELSAKNSVTPLLEAIESRLNSFTAADELMLVSTRQVESVSKALREVAMAKEPLEQNALEFFSYHINSAVEALGEVTRPYRYEEVLDKMFSDFCLGK
ncbi:MAG TPA: tRNA uridine-5-carboxymethylaminomethyl(34) synthesis GTPase MnmE [Nitratifractor sp.]|nr:tRNA uridine-5-carboxymethylaminomethyl(34) synthesis GTPase MnmE [Nitratifractor sp.]HHD74979.1 tRNA uridine-5-carboxymethylaminomethyl(34) synthesis GTPase MnmE [Nitratifractor sp.]